MAKYYPQKQTLVIAIVCILVVVATGVYVYSEPAPQTTKNIEVEQGQNAQTPISLGNVDWKKQFYAISSSTSLGSDKGSSKIATDTPLTLTDKVGRDFFARYIELKQNNLDTNQQLVQGVIDQTIANAQVGAEQTKLYTINDISVSNDSSNSSIHMYGNSVGDIFGKYGPNQNPADIAYDAFNKNDMSVLSQIDPIINQLKKIIQLLIATPVPQPLKQNHLDLINGVNAMLLISQSLRNIEGDPMQSIIMLGKYSQAQSNIMTPLFNIQNYFLNNNITFLKSEPGALLLILKFK